MSFVVFADGSANLPGKMLEGIRLLPCNYTLNGKDQTYLGDVDHFDAHSFYEGLRSGWEVRTSLLNTDLFISHFTPFLEEGLDVIYVSMSSGISGTCNAAMIAARDLMEEYPDRYVHVVDSHGCGFGHGLLAVKAAELGRQGMTAREAAAILDEEVAHSCQYFTVDDLNYLKKTGRISGTTAALGSVLNIKPILYGDKTGHIVSCGKAGDGREPLRPWPKSTGRRESIPPSSGSPYPTETALRMRTPWQGLSGRSHPGSTLPYASTSHFPAPM